MPLVAYPNSDEDQDSSDAAIETQTATGTASKRKRSTPPAPPRDLPPLPVSFHDLYATNVRTGISDDPSLHGGRKRQMPHVVGNWPTHVYLEWRPKAEAVRQLQNMVTAATGGSPEISTLLQSDLGAPLPLHISLSRSLGLQTHQREEFLARLRRHLGTAAVRSFDVHFSKIAWYPNYERTRWFLSLGVRKPEADQLNKLLGASNDACYEMKQPELYVPSRAGTPRPKKGKQKKSSQPLAPVEPPDCSDSFHVSLAWSLEPQSFADGSQEIAPEDLVNLSTHFDCVKVKIGNSVSSLPLHSSKISFTDKGLIG